MSIYDGSSKAKDLYYGGTKIKEAYYGSTKVYNSRPLYYCYRTSDTTYLYFNKYPEVGDNIYIYMYSSDGQTFPGSQAPSSAYIYPIFQVPIKSVTETQVVYAGWGVDVTVSRYSSGDLYT